jgi:hypothetical protein
MHCKWQFIRYELQYDEQQELHPQAQLLLFHQNMFTDLNFDAELLLLGNKRQALIDYNLRWDNLKRRNFDYEPGPRILTNLAS